ncbi:MAG: hypothetical protein FWD71_03085 [Oscillospiraceae bacterium]|nr:hypothetical protein [Oscillospiraceae bacterium]
MFCDIKNDIGNPTVRKLVSGSMWDKSTEAIDKRAAEFQRREGTLIYVGADGNPPVILRDDYLNSTKLNLCPLQFPDRSNEYVGKVIMLIHSNFSSPNNACP